MLTYIHIKNFLYFKDTHIEFKEGLNVFTGETGAGKSLILDAIQFVLGSRKSYDEGTYVELTFQVDSPHSEDGVLILAREIKNSKSVYYLNGRKTVRSVVSQISTELIEIHGQYENQNLLIREFHRELLDKFSGLEQVLKNYQSLYSEYREISGRLNELRGKQSERLRTIDILNYQIKEIEELNLKRGEKEELERVYNYLKNIKSIKEAVYQSLGTLSESVLPELKVVEKALSKVSQFDERLLNINSQLRDGIFILEDVYRELTSFESQEDYDILRIEDRLNQINFLERKYNTNADSLLDVLNRLKEELDYIENLEYEIPQMEERVLTLKKKLETLASEISTTRREKSGLFSEKVMEHLRELGFLNCDFTVSIEDKDIDIHGKDRVEFLFSGNKGFEPKPLQEVASGGEISRLSLALKLVSRKSVPTMIFDEIDTGIGGKTAVSMAKKLKELSQDFQIILITHLPQIAAISDSHYHVEKIIEGDRTVGLVRELYGEDRVLEIARMLRGDTDSLSVEYAKNFIESIR